MTPRQEPSVDGLSILLILLLTRDNHLPHKATRRKFCEAIRLSSQVKNIMIGNYIPTYSTIVFLPHLYPHLPYLNSGQSMTLPFKARLPKPDSARTLPYNSS